MIFRVLPFLLGMALISGCGTRDTADTRTQPNQQGADTVQPLEEGTIDERPYGSGGTPQGMHGAEAEDTVPRGSHGIQTIPDTGNQRR